MSQEPQEDQHSNPSHDHAAKAAGKNVRINLYMMQSGGFLVFNFNNSKCVRLV